VKRIAVMTSGGDAAGMNPALRAVVRSAHYVGVEVFGLRRGFAGLCEGDFQELTPKTVSGILQRGGTILRTFRHPEFKEKQVRDAAAEIFHQKQVDGLIIIGGDGSFRGGHLIDAEWNVPVVGVPGTIDNDIPGTDYSIGYDTALNIAVDAVDKIRDTATSHGRIFVVEVMGRNSGMLAVATGLCCGAEEVIVPETPYNFDEIVHDIEQGYNRGKQHAIIIVAEGATSASAVIEQIRVRSTKETRMVVLGHVQRGGSPSAFDRILATRLGHAAVDRLLDGARGVMVGLKANEVVLTPLKKDRNKARAAVEYMLELHHSTR